MRTLLVDSKLHDGREVQVIKITSWWPFGETRYEMIIDAELVMSTTHDVAVWHIVAQHLHTSSCKYLHERGEL